MVDLSVCSYDQVAVVRDVLDKGWTKLHADDVQEMLELEAEGKQYNIQCHYFTKGNLQLVVRDRISETLTAVDAVDYKHDFPHALASYICCMMPL